MNLDDIRDDLDRAENCRCGKPLAERVAELVLVGAGLAVLVVAEAGMAWAVVSPQSVPRRAVAV